MNRRLTLGLALLAGFALQTWGYMPETPEQASNPHYRGYTDNVLGWIDLPVGITREVAMHGGQALSKAVKAEVKAEVKAANALLHQAEQPGSKAVRQLTAESQKVGMVAEKGGSTAEKVLPNTETRLLPAPRPTEAPVNVLPSSGGRFIVDLKGNIIPLNPGETFTSSPDARWIQVSDAAGNPTGLRLDGAHPPGTHPDPRARVPHGHVPGVTNPDGTPWLPVNQ